MSLLDTLIDGPGELTRAEKEKLVDELLVELYDTSNRMFTPLYPWIFVRVAAKEQYRNGIYLPQSDQNKTIHEGIVISTWQPCTRVIKGVVTPLSSALGQGDHVLFNHWAGIPITGHPDQLYRIVKERDWEPGKEGGIMAKVEYDELHTRPVEKLRSMLTHGLGRTQEATVSQTSLDILHEQINRQFLLVDRDTPSVTISGR